MGVFGDFGIVLLWRLIVYYYKYLRTVGLLEMLEVVSEYCGNLCFLREILVPKTTSTDSTVGYLT